MKVELSVEELKCISFVVYFDENNRNVNSRRYFISLADAIEFINWAKNNGFPVLKVGIEISP